VDIISEIGRYSFLHRRFHTGTTILCTREGRVGRSRSTFDDGAELVRSLSVDRCVDNVVVVSMVGVCDATGTPLDEDREQCCELKKQS